MSVLLYCLNFILATVEKQTVELTLPYPGLILAVVVIGGGIWMYFEFRSPGCDKNDKT